jgi:hypothetical protein
VICSSIVLADVIDAVSPSTVTVLLDAVALKPEPVIVAAAPSVQVAVIASRVGATLLTGHVPHTGRAKTQEVVAVSKPVGLLVMRDTHQPLKP